MVIDLWHIPPWVPGCKYLLIIFVFITIITIVVLKGGRREFRPFFYKVFPVGLLLENWSCTDFLSLSIIFLWGWWTWRCWCFCWGCFWRWRSWWFSFLRWHCLWIRCSWWFKIKMSQSFKSFIIWRWCSWWCSFLHWHRICFWFGGSWCFSFLGSRCRWRIPFLLPFAFLFFGALSFAAFSFGLMQRKQTS